MQANIKNVEILKKTIFKNREITTQLQEAIHNHLSELEKLKEECSRELNLSENFLNAARIYEKTRQALLLKAEAELAKALRAESLALASGNPVAIAAASAWVVKATHQVYKAKKEYEKAKQNRIRMEKRVELAKKALTQAKNLIEQSKTIFNLNFNIISGNNTILMNRLVSAGESLGRYLVEGIAKTAIEVEKFFKSIGISNIEKELLNTARVEKVEGKIVAKRDITFNPHKLNNLERMKKGKAPIGIDGNPIELHHLKQKDNGIIIEINNKDHKKYSKTLHRYRKITEIDRKEFEKWKRKYWKKRAKDFEMEEEING